MGQCLRHLSNPPKPWYLGKVSKPARKLKLFVFVENFKSAVVGGGGQGVDNYTEGLNNNYDLEKDGAIFAFVFTIPVENTVSACQS